MIAHGIKLDDYAPVNNLDVFISIPTNHIQTSKIKELDIRLRANKYNPIFNFTDQPKTSDIWVVTNNLTNNIIQLHNIFFTVFHKVANVNVYKTGNDKGIFFEWV